ncbi:hypothetical protein ABMA58_17095, partial [Oceanospirillum sp. HFRX-1_2]
MAELHPVYGYINPVVSKIVIPILTVISVIGKKRFLTLFSIASSLFFFGLTGNKAPILYPFIIIFVYYVSGFKVRDIYILFFLLLSFLGILFMFFHDSFPLLFTFDSYMIRRAIFVPIQLNQFYIDFFSQNSWYLWADSKISFGLVSSPYNMISQNLIADVYFSKPQMSANAGWIASGYANAGFAGAVIYSVLVGFLFSYFISVSKVVSSNIVAASSIVIVLSILRSTDPITSLLTHGV